MAGFTEYATVADGGTYTMPSNGYLIIGANGATATVKMNLNETGSADNYDFTETVADATAKAIQFKLPQGVVLTFTGTEVKLIAYD